MLTRKIEIIGPIPPPLGGVSVHIARLIQLLKQNSIEYCVHNHGNYHDESNSIYANGKKIGWYLTFLFHKNKNLVHFHQTMYGLHFIYWMLFSKINQNVILITLHNEHILNPLYAIAK